MTTTILAGDCLTVLDTLPSESVHCVVTSPPYFGLRNYGHSDQLGQEATVSEYVANMVSVFDKLWRVLRNDGTVWLNIGDSYSRSGIAGSGENDMGHNTMAYREKQSRAGNVAGVKPKSLCMIPARVAIALQDYGWYLRSEIIWHKTSAMPESVKDRPTKAHEMIYLLSKSKKYWYDADAVKERSLSVNDRRFGQGRIAYANGKTGNSIDTQTSAVTINEFANLRDVWSLAPAQFKDSHFATFPAEIPRRCILAGCPVGGTVLDPFGGAGTTGLVADRLGRNAILIELNPAYAEMARKRIINDAPMFADVQVTP